jgi:membrane-bound lytic murein transglycosylase A
LGSATGKSGAAGFTLYDTREEIEQGSLQNRARPLCWLACWIDAFFLHVQGSGRVRLPDGALLRLGFAAKSGRPYTSIGARLIATGEARPENMSMAFLKTWLTQDVQRGRRLMWENQSYIFFRELDLPDQSLGALGAAGVQLSPGRSLAMDPRHWPYGLPLWLETHLPIPVGAPLSALNRLMIMQDKGSAIQGPVRGDLYCGWGQEAEALAGHMKSQGRITVLLPRFLRRVMEA